MRKAEGARLQTSKSEQTANVPTRPMDADRPKKLGGRVMAGPVGQKELKHADNAKTANLYTLKWGH